MTGGYNRYISRKKAIRKKRISDHWSDVPWYDNLHQYSKNKIHCSCPLCAAKTKRRKGNNWGSGHYNYSMMDQKRQDAMDYDEESFDEISIGIESEEI